MFEFEVYFDDSGTDCGTPVAVAACYVSSKQKWAEFVRNWDEVRAKERFDGFHMAEFVAKPEAGHKPFCDWDNEKKQRVYGKLASIINTRVRKGFAIAVPKKPFDQHVFPEFKEQYAADHYTWAVKTVMGLLEDWPGAPLIAHVAMSGFVGQVRLRVSTLELVRFRSGGVPPFVR